MANKLFEIQTWEIEDGTDLMNGQSKLKIWSTELEMYKSKKLKNGTRMFKGCYNLSYITDNFPSLTNGTEMFQGCIGLDTAFMDLSSLTNGTDMFNSSNTKINSVKQVGEGEGSCERTYLKLPTGLPNLETSERMFSTSYIRSFDCDMPKLTNGKYMFQYNKVLITFKGDITSLVDGTSMFENCPLQNFDPSPDMTYYNGISDLSSLAYGDYMFYGSKFSTINLNAGSLLHADHMFHFNKNLLQFYSNIASLVTGNYMFAYCENLETFVAPLWELMEGTEMFRDTNLTLESLTNITATIRNRYSMSSGYLWASIDDLPTNIDRNSELTKACMLRLKDKAWAVNSPSYSFNSQTIPQSGPEFKNFINGNYTITNVLGKYLCGTNLKTSQTNCVIGTFDDTNSIVNGDSMFYGSNIRNFDADLRGLTNANYMFGGCSDLLNFTGEVGTNHSNDVSDIDTMFNGCYSLQSVRLILNEATTDMPYFGPGWTQCSPYQLRAVDINGAGVYETSYKFANCRLLSSVHLFLPSVTEARGMFQECYSLTSFTSDIFSSLETACNMFKNCTRLKEFTPSHLSALTNGQEMFYYCKNLASFSSNLPNLTNGWCMFNSCTNLTAFDVDLPSLTYGEGMFHSCHNLTSFSSDLSSLTYGDDMFSGCTSLTSFSSKLSSLTDGEGMFAGCKLDTASVQNIADTINTYKGTIHIGIGNNIPNTQEEGAFNTIASKGWTVYVMGGDGRPHPEYTPTSLDGEETSVPIPFYAKPVESNEQHGRYIDSEGNYYNILGGQFIYGDDLSTYGMFTNEEDAAANMRLTKIER